MGIRRYTTVGYATMHASPSLPRMQRLYSMFPGGLPGLGLLLLRASVGMALVLESFGHRPGLFSWIQVTARVLLAILVAGFLTPFAAALALATHGVIWCLAGISSTIVGVVVCLDAVALALLGPGNYSLDSYRFGRRVVVLPPS
jgi:hypothetical protein